MNTHTLSTILGTYVSSPYFTTLVLPERNTAEERIVGRPIGCSGPFPVIRKDLESHTETHKTRRDRLNKYFRT